MLANTPLSKKSDINRSWHHIDATDVILGRLATRVVNLLRGKHKRTFTPHIDNGDFVVVTNAQKVRLTGKKLLQKMHFMYSGYPGGIKEIPYGQFLKEKPVAVIFEAVKGMLPKNRTRKRLIARLKVYKGSEHPHSAQIKQPVTANT